MMRIVLAIAGAFGLAAPPGAAESSAVDGFHGIRADVDLVAGFEPCPAPPGVYARLQDELLFAVGAEGLLPTAASLAGVGPGKGVGGLLVAVRREEAVAVVPSTEEGATEPTRGHALQWLGDRRVAFGDLGLLSSAVPEHGPAASLPSPLRDLPATRCAWVIARPGWFRGAGMLPEAEVRGRSLLQSLDGIHSMVVTADATSEIELTLRVSAADAEDAALLADALREFLAVRRRNRNAPEAIRTAVERGAVRGDDGVVTLTLPLSEAALDRIRRNPDSRALLRLRLADAQRERWQRVAAIMRALELQEGDSVADVGAGEGFFSVRLARAVGSGGRVFAVEISERAVAALSGRATAASLGSVDAVLGLPDDPRLPAGSLDAALIVNAYHEMPFHEAMLGHLFESLKPGGRLVLVEPWSVSRRDEARADQVRDHLLAPELAEEEVRRAGFEVASRRDDFIAGEGRQQWLLQARRPLPAGAARQPNAARSRSADRVPASSSRHASPSAPESAAQLVTTNTPPGFRTRPSLRPAW
jgi:SAM-dependent methyltransferase